ncbi:MAG TPA: hypothetical protein VNW29_00585 [Candidatus Sulfotelmatobacter sp.]|jgi:hypothetical protein|nr:hypothetical protein [Candidatus Sulfotelmatobacter sp.]
MAGERASVIVAPVRISSRVPTLGRVEGVRSGISTLSQSTVGSSGLNGLKLHTVIPQRRPGLFNNLKEFNVSPISSTREGSAPVRSSFGQNDSINNKTTANSLEQNVTQPRHSLSTDSQVRMSPQEGRTLLGQVYTPKPERVRSFDVRNIGIISRNIDSRVRQQVSIKPALSETIKVPNGRVSSIEIKNNILNELNTLQSRRLPVSNPTRKREPTIGNLSNTNKDKRNSTALTVDRQVKTTGAKYGDLLKERVIKVIKIQYGGSSDSDIPEISHTPRNDDNFTQRLLKIWFYNGSEQKPAWDRLVIIKDSKLLDTMEKHLRGEINTPTLWKTTAAMRAMVKTFWSSGVIDLTVLFSELEKKKKRRILVREPIINPKSITQPDIKIAEFAVQSEKRFLQATATFVQPETIMQSVAKKSYITVGTEVALLNSRTNSQEKAQSLDAPDNNSLGGTIVNFKEPHFGIDADAQLNRDYVANAAINEVAVEEDGLITGYAIAGRMAHATDGVLSGLLKSFGVKIDRSYEALKHFIGRNGKIFKKDARKIVKEGIKEFPAVVLGEGHKVSEEQVRIVIDGLNKKELDLAA